MRTAFLALTLVAAAGPATAQQNQAQQLAYARALVGNWTYAGGGSTITLNNDGSELRATMARPSSAMTRANVKPGADTIRGRFTGPDITGWVLSPVNPERFPNYQRLCKGTAYWQPFTAKANFDRNRIDMTVPSHLVTVENGRCVVVEAQKEPAKFRQLFQGANLWNLPTYLEQNERNVLQKQP